MGGASVLPVHRDGAEVEDGCGAAHDVECDPNVAKLVAENPVSLQVVGYGEDHHQTGDKEVADGQRDDEQVAHFPQRPVSIDIRLQKNQFPPANLSQSFTDLCRRRCRPASYRRRTGR